MRTMTIKTLGKSLIFSVFAPLVFLTACKVQAPIDTRMAGPIETPIDEEIVADATSFCMPAELRCGTQTYDIFDQKLVACSWASSITGFPWSWNTEENLGTIRVAIEESLSDQGIEFESVDSFDYDYNAFNDDPATYQNQNVNSLPEATTVFVDEISEESHFNRMIWIKVADDLTFSGVCQ